MFSFFGTRIQVLSFLDAKFSYFDVRVIGRIHMLVLLDRSFLASEISHIRSF